MDSVISMVYSRVMIQAKFEQMINVKTWNRYLGHVWDKDMEGSVKLNFKWSLNLG